jgi:hypothetical protein
MQMEIINLQVISLLINSRSLILLSKMIVKWKLLMVMEKTNKLINNSRTLNLMIA